ncbi:glycine betaine ABC transporter substrate-binding protein [Streptomyces sp. ME03-5709C]|nr:glycine betaine ABC transporter substrate-binding protein [Streptomyces sp. ME03-5709C]
MRRRALAAGLLGVLLACAPGCGLTSGSPLVDDVRPGSLGKGLPLEGASLTVTSKSFSEQIILGSMIGLVFKAAGAQVLDRTNIQGSIGAREAVRSGAADAMYEYTGTAWITYLGNDAPIADAQRQWRAVRDADRRNGIAWLRASTLDNTYALAAGRDKNRPYGLRTLSDVAALSKKDPGAVTLCVENEFASRDDGLPGMRKAYGMDLPSADIRRMDTGIIYTQITKPGSCLLGEVYTTDGRIASLDLEVMEDDKHFFPDYDAAPVVNSKTLERWPAIRGLLDPLSAKLTTDVGRELNAKVDVEGEDPHEVAKAWLVKEGFITAG